MQTPLGKLVVRSHARGVGVFVFRTGRAYWYSTLRVAKLRLNQLHQADWKRELRLRGQLDRFEVRRGIPHELY